MAEPYYYIRYRWWKKVDLKKVAKDLGSEFTIGRIVWPGSEGEISLHSGERTELRVSADTLRARISSFRAVLFQQEVTPFTSRDLTLRRKIIELYPRSRSTPFPWFFGKEPEFEIVQE